MAPVALALALALTVAVAGCGPRAQPRTPPVVSIVQDDAELLHRSPERIGSTLDDLRRLGVDWVRVTAGWSVIAPAARSVERPDFDATDPAAYPRGAWRSLDRLHEMASARGLALSIDIAFWAPRWAVRRGSARSDRQRDTLDVGAYADFAEAVARRYPRSVAFTIWNEPNHPAFLLPQWERAGDGWQATSPHLYRAMVQAAAPRIEAAAPDALVLIGATASVGAGAGGSSGERMAPATFVREMACVDAQLRPLRTPACRSFQPLAGDGWSHHPYSLERPPWRADRRPGNVRMGDLGRLTRLLRRLHEAGRTDNDLPLYLTESGYQTTPPDPTAAVSLAEQARWLPEAERIARAQPSVRSVAQFLVRDLPERPGRTVRERWGDYQSGLRFEDGRPKPAHAAFELPLVARRSGVAQVSFWGLVRRGSGSRTATISVREPDATWRPIARPRTRGDGTFEVKLSVDPGRAFQLRSGDRVGAIVNGAR